MHGNIWNKLVMCQSTKKIFDIILSSVDKLKMDHREKRFLETLTFDLIRFKRLINYTAKFVRKSNQFNSKHMLILLKLRIFFYSYTTLPQIVHAYNVLHDQVSRCYTRKLHGARDIWDVMYTPSICYYSASYLNFHLIRVTDTLFIARYTMEVKKKHLYILSPEKS